MSSPLGYQPPGAFITHLTKVGFRRHGPVASVDDFEIHNLDLTSLNLDVGILVPFLVSKRLSGHPIVKQEQLVEVLADLDKATKTLQKKLAILTIGGKLMQLDPSIMDDLRVLNVAVIDRSTIDAICNTEDFGTRAKAISAVLVDFLGRESLSPYVSGRPAIGGRFFGRSTLVERMISSAGNFTIIGNRRIGKTSLLKEIRERLKLKGVRTGEIYGATCSSTADVAYKLLQSLGRFREAEHVLTDPKRAMNLASYVHKIPDIEKVPMVAVFIDELDRILEFDAKQNNEVLHLLRETFEGNPFCRVFLAGFRKVMEVARSMEAPGFNFTATKELLVFNGDETYEMVTRPLSRLGIEVANTDLPAAIYKETGGHPELIQIHCASIVRYFQTYKKVPAGVDLLTDVFENEEYRQKVFGAFLANTNPLEALLCYLLIDDADKGQRPAEYEFGPKEVSRVLKQKDISLGIPKIADIITHLKVSGIIAKAPGTSDRYQFSAPQLVNYCIGMDLDFCIEDQLERVMRGEEEGQTLSSEPINPEEEPLISNY